MSRLVLPAPVRQPEPKPVKVTEAEREYVLRRDGCVGYLISHKHVCAGRYGTSHGPRDYRQLTLEHVKEGLQMGLRAPSDRRHMVGACWKLNLQPPTKEQREWMREYLKRVEPDTSALSTDARGSTSPAE